MIVSKVAFEPLQTCIKNRGQVTRSSPLSDISTSSTICEMLTKVKNDGEVCPNTPIIIHLYIQVTLLSPKYSYDHQYVNNNCSITSSINLPAKIIETFIKRFPRSSRERTTDDDDVGRTKTSRQ
jgi:hypothetical protein